MNRVLGTYRNNKSFLSGFTLDKITTTIKKSFFPEVCPVCGKLVGKVGVCKNCSDEIFEIKDKGCRVCGKVLKDPSEITCSTCNSRSHYFIRNVSLFEYEGALKQLMYRFKYKNSRVYSEYFADVALKNYSNYIGKADVIIPIPMYGPKKKERGYNQAEEFAVTLCKRTKIPFGKNIIIRNKHTAPMKQLSDMKRYENLKGVFSINIEEIRKYKKVLLVDDIFTTGATMDACSYILKKAGVEEVYCLTVATGRAR